MDMRDQVKTCLEKAADCERRAAVVTDATHRKTYLELAQLWRDMAQQAETLKQRFLGLHEAPQQFSGSNSRK
jgi:hypothetical protein